jgi:hypothetical protein
MGRLNVPPPPPESASDIIQRQTYYLNNNYFIHYPVFTEFLVLHVYKVSYIDSGVIMVGRTVCSVFNIKLFVISTVIR